jgi:hypothetical protein
MSLSKENKFLPILRLVIELNWHDMFENTIIGEKPCLP